MKNIGLFIDLDNLAIEIEKSYDCSFDINPIINELEQRGKVSVRIAYGDWGEYASHCVKLAKKGFELRQLTRFRKSKNQKGRGKNGADIQLAIDVTEILTTNSLIDTYVIVSGDADFVPLFQKLKRFGKYVYAITLDESKSDLYAPNCNEVISYNVLAGLDNETKEINETLLNDLEKAIEKRVEEGKSLALQSIHNKMIHLNSKFTHKQYGFDTFKEFILHIEKEKLLPIRLVKDVNSVNLVIEMYNERQEIMDKAMEEHIKTGKSTGIVKYKHRHDGYGFITDDDDPDPDNIATDLFFHHSDVVSPSFWDLNEEDKVDYTIEITPKGRAAKEVMRVGEDNSDSKASTEDTSTGNKFTDVSFDDLEEGDKTIEPDTTESISNEG